MIHRLKAHLPSPSMAVALLALFVALGGTGYAAATLGRGSVTSREIRDGSVRARDLASAIRSQLGVPGPRGDTGPAGAKGDRGEQGPQGTPIVHVRDAGDGTKPNPDEYCQPREFALGGVQERNGLTFVVCVTYDGRLIPPA